MARYEAGRILGSMDAKTAALIVRIEAHRLKLKVDVKTSQRKSMKAFNKLDFLTGMSYAAQALAAQRANEILEGEQDALKMADRAERTAKKVVRRIDSNRA